jgi:hypothetical protein
MLRTHCGRLWSFCRRKLYMHSSSSARLSTVSGQREKWVWITKPNFESLLARELERSGIVHNICVTKGMGWVDCEVESVYDSTWGIQAIPNYKEVSGETVSKLAEKAVEYLFPRFDELEATKTSWGMHCLGDIASQGRCKLIGQKIIDILRRKRRHVHKLLTKDTSLEPGHVLIQLFAKNERTLCISVAQLSVSPSLGWNRPLPWPKGKPPIQLSKLPPATSYQKLEELFQIMRINSLRQQTVIELGSYPGGWTWSLLARGYASVTFALSLKNRSID